MTKQFGTIILLFILSASPLMARAPLQRPSMGQVVESEHLDRALKQNLLEPLTQGELMNLLKKTRKDPDVVYRTLNERGVDFDLDRKIEKKMRNAGAGDDMLKAIWKAKPTGRNEKTATLTSSNGVPLHTKNEEAMSYKTMEDESDPDKRLRMLEEFEQRFLTSELMSTVYTQAAKSCREKGGLNKLVDYGEKNLKLDTNNLYSLLMVVIALPQPRMLESNPELSAQRLSRAEEYATRALKLIDGVPARPSETNQQLKKRKAALASDAHTALAMAYRGRDDSAKAIEEFKTAIPLSQAPNPQLYFRLGEFCANSGETNEALEAFAKGSELGHGTVLQ